MLFRPEKMDTVSRIWPILCPSAYRQVSVATYFARALSFDDAVFHSDMDGFSTVQTWCVNQNRLSSEHPADRQGFKPSLSEPLLLPIDGDAIMGGQIVEGGE